MRKHLHHGLFLSTVLLAPAAFAEDATPPAPATAPAPVPACPLVPQCPPPPPPPWKVTTDVGYINDSATGSQKDSLKVHLFGAYTWGDWTNEATADAVSAHDNTPGAGQTERYLAGTKSKRSFTPTDYFFLQTQWEKDRTSDYRYQAFASLGYGRHLIATPTQTLDAEVGAGARHSEPKMAPVANDAIGNASAKYKWQFTPTASFDERLSVESGRVNTVFRSVTEVKNNLSKTLALGLSFDFRRDNGGTGTVERITSVNLSYEID